MKQLLNSAFVYVGYEEFCRSRRVLSSLGVYRKIPKALFEGLIFGGGGGGGGLSTEGNSVSKLIGLALYLEGNLPCLLCFTLYLSEISKYKPPGGGGCLYLEGRSV